MWNLLPYALAAIGGYQGYRSAKDSGASGLGRLMGAGLWEVWFQVYKHL